MLFMNDPFNRLLLILTYKLYENFRTILRTCNIPDNTFYLLLIMQIYIYFNFYIRIILHHTTPQTNFTKKILKALHKSITLLLFIYCL